MYTSKIHYQNDQTRFRLQDSVNLRLGSRGDCTRPRHHHHRAEPDGDERSVCHVEGGGRGIGSVKQDACVRCTNEATDDDAKKTRRQLVDEARGERCGEQTPSE